MQVDMGVPMGVKEGVTMEVMDTMADYTFNVFGKADFTAIKSIHV